MSVEEILGQLIFHGVVVSLSVHSAELQLALHNFCSTFFPTANCGNHSAHHAHCQLQLLAFNWCHDMHSAYNSVLIVPVQQIWGILSSVNKIDMS